MLPSTASLSFFCRLRAAWTRTRPTGIYTVRYYFLPYWPCSRAVVFLGFLLFLSLVVFNSFFFFFKQKQEENRWGKRIARRKMAPEGQKRDRPALLSVGWPHPPASKKV